MVGIEKKIIKIGQAVLEEFGYKNYDTRILYIRYIWWESQYYIHMFALYYRVYYTKYLIRLIVYKMDN